MNTNPAPHQQPTQNPRYQVPYFMQQHADMGWQQPPSMYNPPSRPPMHPYQQKDPQHASPMYGSVPSPYPNNLPNSNLSPNPVIPGYSNPPMGDVNPGYPMHPEPPQAPYIREGGQYYDGSNEFVVRNMVPNNYSNSPAENTPNWDPSLCRPGYQSINGGKDSCEIIDLVQLVNRNA